MNLIDRINSLNGIINSLEESITCNLKEIEPLKKNISEARRFDNPNPTLSRGLREKAELSKIEILLEEQKKLLEKSLSKKNRLISLENYQQLSVEDIGDLIEDYEAIFNIYDNNCKYKIKELEEFHYVSNDINYLERLKDEFELLSEKKLKVNLILKILKAKLQEVTSKRIFSINENIF